MVTNVPPNYPQEPVSGYQIQADPAETNVEQIRRLQEIEEGVRGASEAIEIRDRISRDISNPPR